MPKIDLRDIEDYGDDTCPCGNPNGLIELDEDGLLRCSWCGDVPVDDKKVPYRKIKERQVIHKYKKDEL